MSRTKALWWIVAVLCGAGIALYVAGGLKPIFNAPPPVDKDAKLLSRSSASPAPSSLNRMDKSYAIDVSRLPKNLAQLPATNERKLYDEFNQSKDMAPFVNRAKSIEGGQFFVRMALIYCASIDAKAKVFAIDRAQQENKIEERMPAINAAFGACANMPTELKLREALRETSQEIKNSGDRSMALSEAFNQHLVGNGEGTTAEFISRAISYGNPQLLAQMLPIMVASSEANGKADLIFNGKPVAKEDSGALTMAMGLIACNYGLDCSAQSSDATYRCALSGLCGVDAFEMVRRYNVTPVDWEKVMQVYSQTLQAYQAGNYGFVNVVKRKI